MPTASASGSSSRRRSTGRSSGSTGTPPFRAASPLCKTKSSSSPSSTSSRRPRAMRVLGISGSLRRDSYNTKLLRAAEELFPSMAEVELWEGLKEIPPYDEDDDVEPAPAAVAALRGAIAGADAVLFVTPEYNSSIPGQLKNT